MAALMADSVSKERLKIYKFPLFLFDTCVSYWLKNMLKPGQEGKVLKSLTSIFFFF